MRQQIPEPPHRPEQAELANRLGERGATLAERLRAQEALPAQALNQDALPASLQIALDYWQRAFDGRAAQGFQQRLAWDKRTRSSLEAALAQPLPTRPDWPESLLRLSQHIAKGKAHPEPQAPFSELFDALAASTTQSLLDTIALAFDESLCQQLHHNLQQRLAVLAAPSLFARYQRDGASLGYQGFLDQMSAEMFVQHCLDYPVLARRIVWLVEAWQQHVRAVVQRLQHDWSQLVETFGLAPDARLQYLDTDLSERHDGGAQVCGLQFSDRSRLIYKPRAVALEAAWHGLLKCLDANGFDNTPAYLSVLERDDYGWFAYVESETAIDRESERDYARRAGALCCLAWVFNASDLHSENVIATRRGPCLIDVETLLQPQAPTEPTGAAMHRAAEQVKSSCLSTGLLHFPVEYADGRVVDHSGLLGAVTGETPRQKAPGWVNIGSDALQRCMLETAPVETHHRLCYPSGEPVQLERHLATVVDGFSSMWRFLQAQRSMLLQANGPLDAFRTALTRVVLRPSNLYAQLQQQLLNEAKLQRHGSLPGMLIDTLNRHFPLKQTPPALWPLVDAEADQLERLDIPVARARVDQHTLMLGERKVTDYYQHSGWEVLSQRLEWLQDNSCLERQTQLLRAALSPCCHASGLARQVCTPINADPGDRELLALARNAGDQLLAQAISGSDGSLTWLAPDFLRRQDRDDRGASHYLYDGVSGIAIFLAALSRQCADQRYADAAMAALQPIGQALNSPDAGVLLKHEGIGAYNGLGSLVLAALHLEQISGETRLLDTSAKAASWIDPDRIAADQRLDVEGGAAGALLAVLALHQRQPNQRWLLTAQQLCQHLLDRQQPGEIGAAWPNQSRLLQTGLAHGAAGIAMALAWYHSIAPDQTLGRAIDNAIAYENSLFDRQEGNWPVLLHEPGGAVGQRFMSAWCNGAPGIALGRLTLQKLMPEWSTPANDLALALAAARATGCGPVDHLCCGAAGIADVLLETARQRGYDDGLSLARRIMGDVAQRHLHTGQPLRLHPDPEHNRCFRPGLFRGISGIGYTALRCLDPSLPAVTLPGPALTSEGRTP